MKLNLSEWSTFAANNALLSHDVTEYAMLPVQTLLAWNSFLDDLEETNGSVRCSAILQFGFFSNSSIRPVAFFRPNIL